MSDGSLPINITASKPIIAIDIDDVLASSAKAFVEFSNEKWGTTLTVHDYDEDWARMWELDRNNEAHLELVRLRGAEASAQTIPRMEHAADSYDVLKGLGENFTLIIVTSRRTDWKTDTLVWIKERYAGIFKDDTIYFTGFYDELKTTSWEKSKGDILRDLNVSYLIDDQAKHCNGAAQHGIKALQFGAVGIQASEALDESVVRVKSWNEVAEFFDAERKRISN